MIREFNEQTMMTCLVEDSLLEEMINLPTALYATRLCDSDRPVKEIIVIIYLLTLKS